MSIPDSLLKLDSYYFLLFVIPGFITVWTYRALFKIKKRGDFEYLGLSFFWGLVLFVAFMFFPNIEKLFSFMFGDFFPISLVPAVVLFSIIGAFWAVAAYGGYKLGDLRWKKWLGKIFESKSKKN